jgi:hypothetical protein
MYTVHATIVLTNEHLRTSSKTLASAVAALATYRATRRSDQSWIEDEAGRIIAPDEYLKSIQEAIFNTHRTVENLCALICTPIAELEAATPKPQTDTEP